MDFGLHLPNSGPLAAHADLVALACRAEVIGFDSVWVFDHLFNPVELKPNSRFPGGAYYNDADALYFEALTTLSVVAGATSLIRLGTRVLIPVYRNPALLAKQIGTLAALAGDRVVLGVGAGWMHEEFEAVGVPPAERFERLDEHVELMRKAWRNGVSEFSGRFYSHTRAGFYPVPKREVPIIVGGGTDSALRRIARWGDGWALPRIPPDEDPKAVLTARLDRLHRACDAENRDPDELRLVAGVSIDAEPSVLDAIADAGIHEVDVALADPSDLDLERAQVFLARWSGGTTETQE